MSIDSPRSKFWPPSMTAEPMRPARRFSSFISRTSRASIITRIMRNIDVLEMLRMGFDDNLVIDKIPAERTPAVVKLQPGKYRMTLNLAGYQTWSQELTVGQSASEFKANLQATGR